MADLYEPDLGAAYYRSNDPIKNLNIRVKLEKVTSSSIIPQQTEEKENQNVEMQSLADEVQKDEEERVFHWQEKVFCLRETELYSNEASCEGVMEKKYNKDVTEILEKGKPNNRLFSYVDHDKFSQSSESVQYLTTSANEKPSFLTEKMANLRRRKVGGGKKDDNRRNKAFREVGFVPKINTVDYNPSEELRNRNHIMAAPMQVHYIMADLSRREEGSGTLQEEAVLCMIQMDANGVICMRPDFSKGKKPYVVENNIKGDVFEYTIQHSSKIMNRQEQDKELKMYREVYSRHSDFLQACVGEDFELPPLNVLRLLVYGEMECARDFEYDDLYLHFLVDLPKHWTADRSQQLSWVTQTCRTKVEGRDNVSYFSFPFNFELFYKDTSIRDEDKEPLPHFPIIMVEVLSLDRWNRFRTEGYTYISIPTHPGTYRENARCWRPIGKSAAAELRRFFIGGSPELEDITYTAIPSTFQGSHLSKYGFRTESTGTISTKLNVILQSQAFMEKKANKKTLGNLLDNLGINAVQANIANVLDAFKKARIRMMQARESASRDLFQEATKTRELEA
ncbi:Meckel syndrome type 1 protein-like isoform X1 [Pecten maximus]|uniref:Meckel syndrome type 1 protein-like isoform X1 n=1 Tax=Pecten maximus TaxID=6579 RepID=UPI0014582E36|nr:Meckel syndrome type 1 protein-like isoform X1 [Pecten maximus]